MRRSPPTFQPGPLTRTQAEALNQLARDLYGSLLDRFSAAPPLQVRQGLDGVAFSLGPIEAGGVVTRTTVGSVSSADYGPRPRLNFTEGSNIVIGMTDDPANHEIVITITATAPAGAGIEVKTADGLFDGTGISILTFDQADGFVVSSPALGEARIDLADATPTQKGAVNTTTQSFGGAKDFKDSTTHERDIGLPTGYKSDNIGRVNVTTGGPSAGDTSLLSPGQNAYLALGGTFACLTAMTAVSDGTHSAAYTSVGVCGVDGGSGLNAIGRIICVTGLLATGGGYTYTWPTFVMGTGSDNSGVSSSGDTYPLAIRVLRGGVVTQTTHLVPGTNVTFTSDLGGNVVINATAPSTITVGSTAVSGGTTGSMLSTDGSGNLAQTSFADSNNVIGAQVFGA